MANEAEPKDNQDSTRDTAHCKDLRAKVMEKVRLHVNDERQSQALEEAISGVVLYGVQPSGKRVLE